MRLCTYLGVRFAWEACPDAVGHPVLSSRRRLTCGHWSVDDDTFWFGQRMSEQLPVIDVFIGRDGTGWRFYSAPFSWKTPFSLHLNDRGCIFPVGRPDLDDLDRFMWETDAPYERRPTSDGGVEILARGRSAVTLVIWLTELIEAGKSPAPNFTHRAA